MPRINVRTLIGKNYEVDIDVTCTVKQLKEKIRPLAGGLSVDKQLMLLEDEELADTETLDTYGIVEGETIHLSIIDTRVPVNLAVGTPEVWDFPEGPDTPLIQLWDMIEARTQGRNCQLTYNSLTLPARKDAAGKTFKDFGIRSGKGEIAVLEFLIGGA